MRLRTVLGSAAVVGTLLAVTALLLYNGVIHLNRPSRDDYPVRGVDVSSYQGEIDWTVLAGQDISFAYIKATEGSSHVDSRFAENYREALGTDLRVGAYHFFSYDSPGETQAENFIAQVERVDGMLPPVVDVEFYGDKERNPPEREEVQAELNGLLLLLEEHYGMKPVIYATEKSYSLFIAGAYSGHHIWIRNVFRSPSLSDGREWTFWQYTDREVLEGYEGVERFIDMNVFNGSAEAFSSL